MTSPITTLIELPDARLATIARAFPDPLLAAALRLWLGAHDYMAPSPPEEPASAKPLLDEAPPLWEDSPLAPSAPAPDESAPPKPPRPPPPADPVAPRSPRPSRKGIPLGPRKKTGDAAGDFSPSVNRIKSHLETIGVAVSSQEVAKALGMELKTVRVGLRFLKQRGLAHLHGRTNAAKWSAAATPKPRSSAPAAPLERTVALPVLNLASAEDSFHCAPLKATLKARACVSRQQTARSSTKHPTCKACPLGEQVAKTVKLDPSGTDLLSGAPGGTPWRRSNYVSGHR